MCTNIDVYKRQILGSENSTSDETVYQESIQILAVPLIVYIQSMIYFLFIACFRKKRGYFTFPLLKCKYNAQRFSMFTAIYGTACFPYLSVFPRLLQYNFFSTVSVFFPNNVITLPFNTHFTRWSARPTNV